MTALSRLQSLHDLRLTSRHGHLPAMLANSLRPLTRLTCLHLSGGLTLGATSETAAMLINMLRAMPQLRHLEACACHLPSSSELGNVIGSLRELSTLVLSYNLRLGDTFALALAAKMADMPALRNLVCGSNGLAADGVVALLTAAVTMPALQLLGLQHPIISDTMWHPAGRSNKSTGAVAVSRLTGRILVAPPTLRITMPVDHPLANPLVTRHLARLLDERDDDLDALPSFEPVYGPEDALAQAFGR